MRTDTGYSGRTTYPQRRRRHRTGQRFLSLGMAAVLAGLLIAVSLIGGKLLKARTEVDPHEGQVYIYDGFDWVWMTPLEGVPVNTLTAEYFSDAGGEINYLGNDFSVFRGIDVSEHQKEIDWEKAAGSGIDYVYIRAGRRGYTEGGLFDDAYFEKNMSGAKENGLETGVYMFSQAITVAEALEEAHYILERIKGYDVSLPIVFDWEKIDEEDSRTADVTMEGRTECAIAFCETIKNAGYEACVYFNRNLGYYGYDLSRLTDYQFWFALPESGFPNFYYAADMWQYSFTETVPGIGVETDMNFRFVPKYVPPEETSAIA